MNDFIEIFDDVFAPEFCKQLILLIDQSSKLKPGMAGGIVDPEKKISLDLILNEHQEYQSVLQEITEVTAQCLQRYFDKYRFALIAPIALRLPHPETGDPVALTHENYDFLANGKTGDLMRYLYRLGYIQAQKYPRASGNYNYWHCEVFPMSPHNEQLHRTLLFMFYLNDVEEGGETQFYYQEKSIRPKAGRMVIAPAYFTHTHRGCVPISEDKYILTSWVLLQRAEQLYV